ncbi:MAG: amidohydrolase family protein, partial [Acidobacteriota bacterium]|nr:amidohydrolase family protein [Acidobacteriota bacterium]
MNLVARVFVFGFLSFLFATPVVAQEHLSAIRAARLIDGSGAPPINDPVVLVHGDTIMAVGTAADVSIPASAQIIDLGDLTILPGLIDCHVHITG